MPRLSLMPRRAGRLAVLATAGALALGSFAASAQDDAFEFVWASGSVGGTYNIIVTALAERLKAKYPGTNVDVIPGGSVSNTIRLGRGEFPVAMINSMPASRGYKGETPPEQFEGGFPDLRSIARIYYSHFQFIAPADLEADTIDEVIENKMPITIVPGGPRGHIGVMAMEQLLREGFGLTFDDMEEWGAKIVYAEFGDAANMLRDGQVQLFTPLTAAPNGSILDLASARPIKLLGMSDRLLKVMEDAGYSTAPLPANTYEGQTEPILVTAGVDGFYAREDTDPALVEAITRTLIEDEAYLKGVHVRLEEDFDAETAYSGLGVPLHPAAEAVYEEYGFLK